MEAHFLHAMEQVRAADPERYLSTLYAPEDKRPALYALYAFNTEIGSVRDKVSEPMPGEIRLQWWRDVIADDTEAQAGGNPLAEALLATIKRHELPRQPFLNMLDARVTDLYDDAIPSRNDLEGYLGETRSALIQLASLCLDPRIAGEHAQLAGHAGCAQGVSEIIRKLPLLSRRGQSFIPADIRAAAGAGEVALHDPAQAAAAERVLAALIALGRQHFSTFRRDSASLPQSLRAAYLPLASTGAVFSRAERLGAKAFQEPVRISVLAHHIHLLRNALGGW
ncbi:phytoene/squalene synthase family protein [Nitratireductor basaltis]|uniref:Squalene/phytoene synthase n=1 Tax=Nitratireductor basaltis TaxID=472175 RepID=A0A084UAA7_9HYPH|nr:phytoene/squalene synthase family protein [Nitratireductor basaltis]KFB09893.1 Squalene/phytoene synthase [Nitratireductor basaltis]